ncbi:MAG TPA: polysaccharide deacetylase family protein [Mycobacteriales bacterium]|nr:polysaccharide deacetylase family protein [Mycobacteriales bacterium]
MRATSAAVCVAGSFAAAQIVPAGSWLPSLRRRLAPALNGQMPAGTVALTFDDGPHPDGTPAILDALDEQGWTATFFVLGAEVVKRPHLVAEITARGHTVGVHGYEHRYLLARDPRSAYSDLRRAHQVTADALGRAPLWWRPPYGVLTGPALVAARAVGVRPRLWSAWGKDWRASASPRSIVTTIATGQVDGGVVLLHDSDLMSATGSWRNTAAALPLLADHPSMRGLTVAGLR